MATTAQELETTETTKAALPPGPPRLPYIGNLLALRRDPLGYLQKLQRIYGNMATIYFMKNPAVLLFRPEHVRYVLVEHPRDFSNIGSFQENRGGDDNFGNEGLLTINGEKHRQQRHAVQPAFHKKRVEGYAAIMQQYTQELLKTWQVGDKVDMSRAMQALTLRIVSKCLFSIDLSMQLEPLGDAFDGVIGSSTSMAEDLLNIRIDNPVTGYGKRRAAIRQLNMLIYTLIAQRRDDERDYHDVLSMLMTAQSGEEPGTKLTEKQIHDHILTFLAAGHETTAIALVWTFYLLAQYPEARLKLQDELHSVLGGREPTLEDLAHLPYIWEDAETFKPERWDPANGQQIPPGAYFPFGGGPRTCIGMPLAQMEARIILASVLQKFTPQPVSGYTPGFQPVITLRPKRHLEVTLMPASSGEANAQWKQLVRRNELAVQNGVERKGCRTALLGLLGL